MQRFLKWKFPLRNTPIVLFHLGLSKEKLYCILELMLWVFCKTRRSEWNCPQQAILHILGLDTKPFSGSEARNDLVSL